MRKLVLASCILAAANISFAATFANTANGVWNTGINPSGGNYVFIAGNSPDPHYTLIQTPPPADCGGQTFCGFTSSTYVVLDDRFPIVAGPWLANDTNGGNPDIAPSAVGDQSKWVSARADQGPGQTMPSSNTPYIYRMVFNLTLLGVNPSSASITFRWASDNDANNGNNSRVDLCSGLANAADTSRGGCTSLGSSAFSQGFTSFTPDITVNSGFTGGWMALDFVVFNTPLAFGDNPSGMRVEIINATDGIPEPSTFVLLSGALAGLALLRRKL